MSLQQFTFRVWSGPWESHSCSGKLHPNHDASFPLRKINVTGLSKNLQTRLQNRKWTKAYDQSRIKVILGPRPVLFWGLRPWGVRNKLYYYALDRAYKKLLS